MIKLSQQNLTNVVGLTLISLTFLAASDMKNSWAS